MDFGFSEEQDELRQGVRTVLDAECNVDELRAFELADELGRAEQSANRWAVLAELGAPALVVPEADGGLGLDDVDLVGLLEEAGRACLPEPLLETAALAAPTLAALAPEPSAVAALAALVRDDAIFAVGGIDVGSAAASASPSEVSADGMLRTPRVVGARDADLLLLACRDDDSGWQLHAVPAATCRIDPTPALSSTRDLSTVHWPLASDTLLAYGVAAEAAVSLLADRAAAGTAALLVGLADRMVVMSRRLCQGTPSVRQADRELPGGQAPPGRRSGGARVRPARHLPGGLVAGHRATDPLARRVDGQGDGLRCRRPGRPRRPPGARGHRLHVGVRPPLLLEADLGPVPGLGRRRHTAAPGAAPRAERLTDRRLANTVMSDFRQ